MAADRSYVAENHSQLRRLRDLLDGIDDDRLAQSMDAGWTVASVLAHMAFWDYRIVAQLERWGPDGSGAPPTYEEEAVDWINDAAKPIFLALPPRIAARVAVEAAEAADGAVAGMSDELLATNEKIGLIINPVRAEHRQEHLDELELALRPGHSTPS
jgi:mycothiol maleylpyruvate isomerase-like protein